jgi:hypothetical protein
MPRVGRRHAVPRRHARGGVRRCGRLAGHGPRLPSDGPSHTALRGRAGSSATTLTRPSIFRGRARKRCARRSSGTGGRACSDRAHRHVQAAETILDGLDRAGAEGNWQPAPSSSTSRRSSRATRLRRPRRPIARPRVGAPALLTAMVVTIGTGPPSADVVLAARPLKDRRRRSAQNPAQRTAVPPPLLRAADAWRKAERMLLRGPVPRALLMPARHLRIGVPRESAWADRGGGSGRWTAGRVDRPPSSRRPGSPAC